MNHSSRRVRPGVWASVAAALTAIAVAVPLRAQHVEEYRLKAALLFNLAKFVDWPEEAFTDTSSPLVVCVLGKDPFGAGLDDELKGRTVKGHPSAAKRITEFGPGCHVLFIANSETKRLPSIVQRVRDTNVLTIGEAPGFIDRGGIIGLITEDERVRFEVNVSAAERAGVKISARVMALAVSVKRVTEHKP